MIVLHGYNIVLRFNTLTSLNNLCWFVVIESYWFRCCSRRLDVLFHIVFLSWILLLFNIWYTSLFIYQRVQTLIPTKILPLRLCWTRLSKSTLFYRTFWNDGSVYTIPMNTYYIVHTYPTWIHRLGLYSLTILYLLWVTSFIGNMLVKAMTFVA